MAATAANAKSDRWRPPARPELPGIVVMGRIFALRHDAGNTKQRQELEITRSNETPGCRIARTWAALIAFLVYGKLPDEGGEEIVPVVGAGFDFAALSGRGGN